VLPRVYIVKFYGINKPLSENNKLPQGEGISQRKREPQIDRDQNGSADKRTERTLTGHVREWYMADGARDICFSAARRKRRGPPSSTTSSSMLGRRSRVWVVGHTPRWHFGYSTHARLQEHDGLANIGENEYRIPATAQCQSQLLWVFMQGSWQFWRSLDFFQPR
jgi:hypothetical protein